MAYLINKIGEHQFSFLRGSPVPPRNRVMVDDREGVDGQEFTLQGVKGKPFQMLSMVDTDTYEEAQELPNTYAQATQADLLELIHNDKNYTSQGWKVKVLDVDEVEVRRIDKAVGNKLSTNAQGWCVCVWTLIAVSVTEEEA